MGVSTNGMIGFGVIIQEDTELPWDHDRYQRDIEEWWLEETGFKPTHHPFDDADNYNHGWTEEDPRLEEYSQERNRWMDGHLMPVQVENYQSDRHPAWALLVPGTVRRCYRGFPLVLNPRSMVVSDKEAGALVGFTQLYGLTGTGPLGWHLMSYWG